MRTTLLGALLLLTAMPAAWADDGDQKDEQHDKKDDEEKDDKKGKKQDKPKVKVSGYLTVYYKFRIDQDANPGTEADLFRLGKAQVQVAGDLDEHVGYTVEFDPRSPTILGLMRDAYIKLMVIPKHEIRLGQQKTQFGYENGLSSTKLYTITRSELSESLGRGVTHRDLGVGLIGHVTVAPGVRIEDAVTVVNGAGFGVQADDTHLKNVWGRVGVRYKDKEQGLVVRAGLSGGIGDQMSEADPTADPPEVAERFLFQRVGADVEVDHPWFFASVEVAYGRDELPAGSGEWESSIAYTVEAVGKTKWKVGPVVRYDTWDAEDFQRVTVGAYWGDPDDRFRVISHYEWFENDDNEDDPRHDGRVTTQALVRF